MTEAPQPVRPRVVLLTYPGLFGALVIAEVLRAPGIDLVGIGLSGRIFKGKGHIGSALHFIRRTGWRYAIYNFLLTDLAWTTLRLFSGLGRALRRADTVTLTDCNSSRSLTWAAALSPDYIVSCYFNQKIGAGLIALPRLRCINVHPALLPAHRGPEPVLRAMEDGVPTTGITVHCVDDEIDTGPVLMQQPHPIAPGMTHLSLSLALWSLAAWAIGPFIADDDAGERGSVQPERSDAGPSWPTPAEVLRFRAGGGRFLTITNYLSTVAAVGRRFA